MTDQLKNFGTVYKLDFVSDTERGIVEIEYGSSEIIQLLTLAINQLPDKPPTLMKAKSTVMSSLIGNIKVEVTGSPVLNKKRLKESEAYLV